MRIQLDAVVLLSLAITPASLPQERGEADERVESEFRTAKSPLPSPEVSARHYEKSSEELRMLSDNGDLDARLDLAWRHKMGERAEQDFERAVALFRSAVEAGSPRGMTRLAECYCYGLGVERDYAESLRLNKAAVDTGDLEAMSSIGFAYFNGWGVEQDQAKAVQWYRKAAEGGGHHGHNNLSFAYEQGHGVEQDAPADQAQEEALVPGRPVHHGGDGEGSIEHLGRSFGHDNRPGFCPQLNGTYRYPIDDADINSPGKAYPLGTGAIQSLDEAHPQLHFNLESARVPLAQLIDRATHFEATMTSPRT